MNVITEAEARRFGSWLLGGWDYRHQPGSVHAVIVFMVMECDLVFPVSGNVRKQLELDWPEIVYPYAHPEA